MFVGFFYLLRARGLHATLSEWMTMPEGLALGPHRNSLTGFYVLCRAVPVHTEADYDRFSSVFLEYFDGVPFEGDALPEGRRYVSAVGRGAGARDEKAAGKQIRKYTVWRAF